MPSPDCIVVRCYVNKAKGFEIEFLLTCSFQTWRGRRLWMEREMKERLSYDLCIKTVVRRSLTYLDDSVLGRPAALPLEHGVDIVGLRHAHGLRLGSDGGGGHVPLARVFVQFEVVEPLKWRLRAHDDLVAMILNNNVQEKYSIIL